MEFLNSSKAENHRNPKNSGARKTPQTSPENNPSKSTADTAEAQHRARHQQRNHTTGQRQATETSNAQEQPQQAQKHGRTRRHKKQSKQHQRHADTRHSQHPRKPGTAHTPTRSTHSPRHQRQTPATTGPAPSLENTEKRISTVRLVYVKCWLCTTISHRARDMPSIDELALSGCFGPL